MGQHNIQNAIVSDIELEDSRDHIWFAIRENLEKIFEGFLCDLKELEERMLAQQKKSVFSWMVEKILLPFS